MKIKKTLLAGLIGATMLSLGLAAPAIAAEEDAALMSAEQLDTLEQFWEEFGVSAETQDSLVAGIEDGTLPLSLQNGVTPLGVVTDQVGVFQRTTETFADGSITISDVQNEYGFIADEGDFATVEASDPGYSAFSSNVTNCSVSSGSGYSNRNGCLVRGWSGSVAIWFYADWTQVAGAGNDYIRRTFSPGQTCTLGYACSIPSRSQWVPKETATGKAGATYTSSVASPFGSHTAYVNLWVGTNIFGSSFTMP